MSMYKELKICLLGDSGVGKSSVVQRFVHNTYTKNNENTIGCSFMSKTVIFNKDTYKLNIWDTAGQERYRALVPMYYRNSAACIIVYSIDSKSSFDSLQTWVRELKQGGSNINIIAITGNKCDLKEERQVTIKDGQTYAQSIDAMFFEISAKTGQNVNDLFHTIINKIAKSNISVSSNQQDLKNLSKNLNKSSSCCGGVQNKNNDTQ